MDETDPAKSKALESSLWELETLKSHYHPGVATAASKIDKPFPKVEWEISEYLELSTSEVGCTIAFIGLSWLICPQYVIVGMNVCLHNLTVHFSA